MRLCQMDCSMQENVWMKLSDGMPYAGGGVDEAVSDGMLHAGDGVDEAV